MLCLYVVRRTAVLLLFAAVHLVVLGQAPRIEKIDPPGWYTALPDPMLLIKGENLTGATFQARGEAVRITRTQISDNGHWAFVWLSTINAQPQTIAIEAHTPGGDAAKDFVLTRRQYGRTLHSGFSSNDVLYLIMTDRFADGNPANDQPGYDRAAPRGWHGGDFAGIEKHLDYLQQLGVTAVWTTPVASNAGMSDSYHGYAATDLYAVDSHFGTLADYRRLSDALHQRGMKLVIDLVPNHIGVQHPWVTDPPAPNWLHGTLQDHRHAQGDFHLFLDPHASKEALKDLTEGWFTDSMPDLNQENPLVRQYLIQNALWWVEFANLDGIRLDTFPYIDRAFWHDFHATLHETYPNLTTVGEVFDRDPEVTSFFAGGRKRGGIDTGLDTPFDFPLYFALRDALTANQSMISVANVLQQDTRYPHPERLVTFIGNHDTSRFITDAGGSLPKLKLAMGLLLTLRGMPQIYSGDEIAMSGGNDPDNRHDFPGGFPGDKHNAFVASGRTPTEQDAFAWTSHLLALRKQQEPLRAGMEENLAADDNVLAFVRTTTMDGCSGPNTGERLLVVMNKDENARALKFATAGTALDGCTSYRVLEPTRGAAVQVSDGSIALQEKPQTITIYAVN